MKLRTSLGAGIAAAAVVSTVIGTATPSLATVAPAPWNSQVGDYGAGASGVAVSGDGSTAFVVVTGAGGSSLVPVDLSSGTPGAPVAFSASSTVGSPVANGDTVAIAGYDADYKGDVWTVSNGAATAITLPGDTGNGFFVQGVTTTADGFLAVGSVGGCLTSWTWATGDTTATQGTTTCNDTGAYMPFAVATAPTGTVYAVVADQQAATTDQLWDLSDPASTPITLPDALGSPSGMTVAADGTVYVAGAGSDGTNTQVAAVDPSNPGTIGVRGTGAYPSGGAQLGLVGGKLWLGSWSGISVLDPADATSYTPDAPAPVLTTDQGGPQGFVATADADYLLLPSDAAFTDPNGVPAPGLLEVTAPAAPAPTASLSGTTATVTWDAATNGGTTITGATVVATDTTTDTALTPVTTSFFADAGTLDGTTASVDVSGLTRGHTYTFAVTQDNGFFTSGAGTSAPLSVPLPATPRPSAVAVAGTPQVGTRLTIRTTGSWPTGTALTYAWYAGTTKVGTAASYTPKAADAGKKIKVAVTGTSAGHSPSTVTSAQVGPVSQPVYKVPNKPTITGTAAVGKILTAHITGLPAGATVKYQWAYNGGQYGGPIGRPTTTTTLKVPASVRGTRIEVIAQVTVPGYRTGSAMSALTAVVR